MVVWMNSVVQLMQEVGRVGCFRINKPIPSSDQEWLFSFNLNLTEMGSETGGATTILRCCVSFNYWTSDTLVEMHNIDRKFNWLVEFNIKQKVNCHAKLIMKGNYYFNPFLHGLQVSLYVHFFKFYIFYYILLLYSYFSGILL